MLDIKKTEIFLYDTKVQWTIVLTTVAYVVINNEMNGVWTTYITTQQSVLERENDMQVFKEKLRPDHYSIIFNCINV